MDLAQPRKSVKRTWEVCRRQGIVMRPERAGGQIKSVGGERRLETTEKALLDPARGRHINIEALRV